MRFTKMLGLALAACAVMAAFAAASASALTVTSCEGSANCKTTSVNTTFNASSSNVKLSNGFLTNTCSSTIGGKVTDVSSAGAGDLIDADITEAAFTSCNLAPVHVAGLPWTLETDAAEFPNGKVTGVHVTLTVPLIGTCTFAEDATHIVTMAWTNGASKSTVTLGGSLNKTAGPAGCGSTGTISGTYTLGTVADPGYAKATNLRID